MLLHGTKNGTNTKCRNKGIAFKSDKAYIISDIPQVKPIGSVIALGEKLQRQMWSE